MKISLKEILRMRSLTLKVDTGLIRAENREF
jgi:hypothetical protein